MQILDEVCFEKAFYRWCDNNITSSTVIALEKAVSDVQKKVEKKESNKTIKAG